MAGVWTKLLDHSAVKIVRYGTHQMFSKYLLATNTTIAFSLAGVGDLINQNYEKACSMRSQWNPVRTRNQCLQGLVLGPLYHYWYIALDRALPGYAARTVVKKVFVDQLVMAPICVLIYLCLLGKLEGLSDQEIVDDLKIKGIALLSIEWTVGPCTQLINFFLLPTRFRVLYDSTTCLAYDAYYSYVKYRKGKDTTHTDLDNIPKSGSV